METRMERYAKYREEIRRMPPEEFPSSTNEDGTAAAKPSSPIPFEEEGESESSGTPFMIYLSKRKFWFAVKVGLLILVIIAFVIWWVLLQGRK